MPLYEFECAKCSKIFEEEHRMSLVPSRSTCPKCGRPSKKLLSIPAIHTDAPAWIDKNLNDHLGNKDGPPIETRKDLESYTAKKNFVQID